MPWPEKLCYVIDEAVAASGVSRRKVYEAMQKGELRYTTVGGRRRIFPADLMAWLRRGIAA